jgi:trk system potassium uptake protein TrkA
MVVGLGQFGEHVATRLSAAGEEVLAVDKSMERVEAMKDHVTQAARADCTSEEAMRALGAAEVEVAVIALGEEDFEPAVLGTALLKGLGVANVVARSSSTQRGKILKLAGASRIVYPEAEMGAQLAHLLLHSSVSSSAALPSGYTLAEVRVPGGVSSTLRELRLDQTHGLSVVALSREGESLEPKPEQMVQTGDLLLLAGRTEKVNTLATSWERR